MWQYMQTTISAQLDNLMDPVYCRLNKKLDNLQHKEIHNRNTTATKHTCYTRIVNLTQTKFSNDQINTLQPRLDYAIETNPNTIAIH